eukprot:TRINITY_DN19474_c0_g1_i1.p1 TRINITY_DN19474_c0_g1~~TRINITY_DN19474_c0_g1_i1.p1  ORF type:complete len:294 (+),score=64.64 TRINITY_DN19474_c0_g1_i1:184-1065(+)
MHVDLSNRLLRLSKVYQQRGKLELATTSIERVIGIFKANHGDVSFLELGTSYGKLAHVYSLRGEPSFAKQFYRKAAHVFQQALERQHHDVSFFTNKLNSVDVQRRSTVPHNAKVQMPQWVSHAAPMAFQVASQLVHHRDWPSASAVYADLLKSARRIESATGQLDPVHNCSLVWAKISGVQAAQGHFQRAGVSLLLGAVQMRGQDRTISMLKASVLFRQAGSKLLARRLLLRVCRQARVPRKNPTDDMLIRRIDALYQLGQLHYSMGQYALAQDCLGAVKVLLMRWGTSSVDY